MFEIESAAHCWCVSLTTDNYCIKLELNRRNNRRAKLKCSHSSLILSRCQLRSGLLFNDTVSISSLFYLLLLTVEQQWKHAVQSGSLLFLLSFLPPMIMLYRTVLFSINYHSYALKVSSFEQTRWTTRRAY